MADAPLDNTDRVDELLALREVGTLSLEEHAELDERLAESPEPDRYDTLAGRLITFFDEESGEHDAIPPSLAAAVKDKGRRAVGTRRGERQTAPMQPHSRRMNWLATSGWAAAALIAIGAAVGMFLLTGQLRQERDATEVALAEARRQVNDNTRIIETSRQRGDALQRELSGLESEFRTAQLALADEKSKRLELASRLADATAALGAAELRIAAFEAPIDPAELRMNRQKLLDVPGTVRLAWQPFDLPDDVAEQQGVTGDVVWNDELEQGYLRFVGLVPNDPSVEQYQVWVIDERGLEQKVSGGVFDADAEGEIVVPIDPAIDVGRVALFAVTIEEPGGTWVPDLARRVVVAQPRG